MLNYPIVVLMENSSVIIDEESLKTVNRDRRLIVFLRARSGEDMGTKRNFEINIGFENCPLVINLLRCARNSFGQLKHK